MAPLRHLRSLSMLFAPSFTSSLSTLAISVARIRLPNDPAKLYFGANPAVSPGGKGITERFGVGTLSCTPDGSVDGQCHKGEETKYRGCNRGVLPTAQGMELSRQQKYQVSSATFALSPRAALRSKF